MLSGILYGIENKLTPPGEAAPRLDNEFPLLPHRPAEALSRLAEGELLCEYISQQYIDLYALCKREELQRFERHVTALETEWMLKTA